MTPDAAWALRPASWDQGDPRWDAQVQEAIDRHRGGHCVVVADCRC